MEKLEDIETFYQKENERLDKSFIDKIKVLKNISEAKATEKAYKEQLKSLRDQYNKRFNAFVLDQKNRLIKESQIKSKKRIKGKATVPLNIKKIDIKDNWKTRLKVRWEIFKFNFMLRKSNFIKAITINPIIILRVKIKLFKKRFSLGLSNYMTRTSNSTKDFFEKSLSNTKDFITKSFTKIKNFFKIIFKFIIKLFTRTKKDTKEKEKRPDEEIAEKIMQKSQEKSG